MPINLIFQIITLHCFCKQRGCIKVINLDVMYFGNNSSALMMESVKSKYGTL